MSVVCCKILKDKIEIASDSIMTIGRSQTKGSDVEYAKLDKINDIIIGSTGSCEESALFQLYCKTHSPKEAKNDDILEFVIEFIEWKRKKIDKWDYSNNYILAFHGKAFWIENYFVNEIKTYRAIGAGRDFAMAALFLGHSVEESVSVACELSTLCEKPIIKFECKR